jgi:DNA adenine methylase
VNLRGEFNVPYGYKTHLETVDAEQLIRASKTLKHAKLRCCDFEKATKDAKAGDLVYFDPPYTVAHSNNGFVKYNENIFSWADQIRLAQHAKSLADRGCHVMVSNADHSSVSQLYLGSKKIILKRHSVIAASSQHRRQITESLFIFGGRNCD